MKNKKKLKNIRKSLLEKSKTLPIQVVLTENIQTYNEYVEGFMKAFLNLEGEFKIGQCQEAAEIERIELRP